MRIANALTKSNQKNNDKYSHCNFFDFNTVSSDLA